MNINVYIDGFNVYFCTVRGTPYKWLDLRLLCANLFPTKTISKLKYFSAKVKAVPWDASVPTRQEFYWRALGTIPNLEITKGNFVSWPRYMPRFPFVYGKNGRPKKVRVLRTEEKGSDVNLGAYLIYDNCVNNVDESIVISNDSDLVEAIKLVTTKLNKPVIVVNPNRTKMVRKDPVHCHIHKELVRVATDKILSINEKVLVASQFPQTLSDVHGTFSKPSAW